MYDANSSFALEVVFDSIEVYKFHMKKGSCASGSRIVPIEPSYDNGWKTFREAGSLCLHPHMRSIHSGRRSLTIGLSSAYTFFQSLAVEVIEAM